MQKGYSCGWADGNFGVRTAKSLQQFLFGGGFLFGWVDGNFGPRSVKALQAFLTDRRYLNGWIDGDFGPLTASALQRFLMEEGCSAKQDFVETDIGERRVALDGHAYTLAEFQRWYPRKSELVWQTSRALSLRASAPVGLTLARVSPSTARAALHELKSPFLKHGTNLEIGWRLGPNMDRVVATEDVGGVRSFPCVMRLISEAMSAYQDSRDVVPRINITCRRYHTGSHGLSMHADRPYWYEEDVYGCVLDNSSTSFLEFHSGGSGPGECFILQEPAGACFLQQGEARYQWKHGVPPIARGERFSVSWRWFKKELM